MPESSNPDGSSEPGPSSPPPVTKSYSINGMTFNGFDESQMNALVLQMMQAGAFNQAAPSAVPASQAAPVVPVAPTMPAFIAPPPTNTGESIFERFYGIEAGLLLNVLRHDIMPLDIFKLDSKLRTRAEVDDGAKAALLRDGAAREYPSIFALTTPLSIYFAILIFHARTAGNAVAVADLALASLAYIRNLTEFSHQYQWSAVLRYHNEFHLMRHQEMLRGDYTGWGKKDGELIASYLIGFGLPRNSDRKASSTPAKAQTPIEKQTCFAFETGTCTSLPCPNGRLHKCRKCGSADHGVKACTSPTRKAT